jgi:antirestriction protein ArdC
MKDVEVIDPNTGEKKMQKRRVGYADTSVFNLDQIDGLDELRTASDREPVPVTEAEKALFDAYKDAPPIKNSPQDSAYYSTVEDAIYLPNREQFASEEGYFETLAHEMIHSTGHSSRLDRTDLTDKYGTHRASRAEEELIAEIGTAILASMLGVDLDINQPASYIASWLESLKDDKGMILKAAIASQKAADYILKGANLGSYGKSGEEIARDRVS